MIHHVELYVTDLERSLAFWTPFLSHLGYHESQRWSEGVSYLAFHARSRAHVDEVAGWVKSAGFACLYDDLYPHAGGPGDYALYCEDPDRIKVELVAPHEA